MSDSVAHGVQLELYSSSFCAACRQTRAVLGRVTGMLPTLALVEHDVAAVPELAESNTIVATPTVIVRNAEGKETFRAAGVPTVEQVLRAVALAASRNLPTSE
ncbi:thioredoxin family protein [Salinibacterium sp. SYSU T00001]|uniref:thioredoxin family protein n=1 Tax=Homoserinimonas sedimenticola TaxID=2986805 RepID=UPI0022358737|nr:thioredoxin family protein [Salinibacterium sedimenticola]MCW4385650.1 thioredoxin family protein [Salinibacterium sedimenticola]